MRAIINSTKNILEKGRTKIYHFEHNKKAKKMLKIAEDEKGKLQTNHKKLCIEYAKDVLGNERYAPWLFVYSAYAKEFKEGWIPDNYYGEVVLPRLNGEYGKICNRNATIYKLLEESNTLDICYYVSNLFLNTNYEVLNEEKLKHTLFNQNSKIVYKLENSRQGKGVYFFDEKSFDINVIRRMGSGVFQKFIEQHPFFSEFNDSSVATIRITSVCDDNGNIEPRAGYFRFGRKNDTHVTSASQMRIPLNIKNGQLYEKAYFTDTTETNSLPDTDIEFAGMLLPSFDKCLSQVKKMHHRIPYIRCIGWDIILDKNDNVRIIEANGGHNAITFNETVQGPCFKGLNWENLNKIKKH